MLLPVDPTELEPMERQSGPIPRRPIRLELSAGARAHWWPLLGADRRAEVVLILPRPAGRVVMIRKPSYPAGIIRLPTGGVGPQEGVLAAAEREALEETGLAVRPERVLGLVDWTFAHDGEEQRFASYLCLFPHTDWPLQAIDPHEQISAFYEVPPAELARVAIQLEQIAPEWQSWGRQRAAPHRMAHQLLAARPE